VSDIRFVIIQERNTGLFDSVLGIVLEYSYCLLVWSELIEFTKSEYCFDSSNCISLVY